jgi:hypothetical protein
MWTYIHDISFLLSYIPDVWNTERGWSDAETRGILPRFKEVSTYQDYAMEIVYTK